MSLLDYFVIFLFDLVRFLHKTIHVSPQVLSNDGLYIVIEVSSNSDQKYL